MSNLNNTAICNRLHELCVNYQTHLETQLHKKMGHAGINYRYSSYAIEQQYGKEVFTKPTSFTIKNKSFIKKDKLQQLEHIVKTYDLIEELRCQLLDDYPVKYSNRDSEQKLIDFHLIFSTDETKNTIKAHNDSRGMRFIETVTEVLASFLFKVGLATSLRNTGSYRFWKSKGEKTLNEIECLLKPIEQSTNQSQIMSQ